MSKNTLVLPKLTPLDILKLNQYAKDMRAKVELEELNSFFMEIDHERRVYIVKKNGRLGYIQKIRNAIIIQWKNSDEYELVNTDISLLLEKYNIFPDDNSFNINGIKIMVNEHKRGKAI